MFRCCFGHVCMLGLHVSLLFRSCMHVRATCSLLFRSCIMLGLHVSLLFRSCMHVRATCFVVVSVMYAC